MPSRRMSYILTYVRVALKTSDVQSTLEIPATDKIHMEDRTMVLPELSRTMAYTTRNTVNDLCIKSYINPVVPERSKKE